MPTHIELESKLRDFMDEFVYPNEAEILKQNENNWQISPLVEDLKIKARQRGMWNLFVPDKNYGPGLSNAMYAPLCELMGRSLIAPELFNCNAPDTGNMETLIKYASDQQKERWLAPLLEGRIRSTFCMTEPDVASSDAKNIQSSIKRDGDHYVINGRKWWSTGAGDPRCELLIFMGKTDPDAEPYRQQSMILIPKKTEGVKIVRHLSVFGYDHAPRGHMEIQFSDVRVPVENMLLGEGRGFEIAQGRLGPGRIHHCMRLVGTAERALELMCQRVSQRVAFGRPLAEQGTIRQEIALSRMEIDQARLLTLNTAEQIDSQGAKAARARIAQIKVVVPRMACAVLDRAIQAHGGAGVSSDFFLAAAWSQARSTRLADGPDEVHIRTIAKAELAKLVVQE
ncbi:MAG: acyl-CoA dehydrogenase [Parasphingorhabdus sp.]|jgi:acyl-CoA dehydrogenase